MSTAPATVEAPTEVRAERPTERKAPEIAPANVSLDLDGLVLRHIVVRLPEDFVTSDLAEPGIWRRVQMSGAKALRKLDHLTLIAHDEGYIWHAVVSQAGPSFAVLAKPTGCQLQARRTEYFSDDLYIVRWNGATFDVRRRTDNHTMSTGHANEPLAIKALRELYPRPV